MHVPLNLFRTTVSGGSHWRSPEGLSAHHPEHHFVLISDRRYDDLPVTGSNVEYITIPFRTVHPLLWYVWHECFLPGVLKKIKADMFVAPDGIIPLRTDVPCIPVIHDLNHEHRPGDIPRRERLYFRHFFPLFAKKAVRVATVSEFSAKDIAATYGIDSSKIDVVPNGVADIFSPPLPGEAEETTKGVHWRQALLPFCQQFLSAQECRDGDKGV